MTKHPGIPLEEVAELLDSPIEPGPPDLIPGLIPKKGQVLIVGETNVGKSTVAIEICSSLVTGAPLWDQLQPTIEAKKIAYILGEHHNDTLKRIQQRTKLPMRERVWLLGPQMLGNNKSLVVRAEKVESSIRQIRDWVAGVDLVVFDPLSAFISGEDAENDNIGMRKLLNAMDDICQPIGAACLILGHSGKPMIDQYGKAHAKKSYATRGASGIEDAATNVFYMVTSGGKSGAAEGTDGRVFSLVTRKYKDEVPSEYQLIRNLHTGVHRLIEGTRPFIEIRRQEVRAKYHGIKTALPELTERQIVRMLVETEGKDTITIRRYLGFQE